MKNKKAILVIIINVIYISSIIILSYYVRTLIILNNELKVQLSNQNEEILKVQKNNKYLNDEIKRNDNSYKTEYDLQELENRIEDLKRDSHYHY